MTVRDKVVSIRDGLVNFVANIGTARDKQAGAQYLFSPMSDADLDAAYRGAWLPRKLVDAPALDSCRMWRNWQADKEQISAVEAEETRLDLRKKVLRARKMARLFGGCALFIGTREENVSRELNPETIRKDGISYVTVILRRNLAAGEIELDPMAKGYGLPMYYTVSSPTSQVRIHPSRLVIFTGAEIPDPELSAGYARGWSDSVLQSAYQACLQADSVTANIASLTFEAKVDVFQIPDLAKWMQGDATNLLERFRLAAIAKGINGTLLLDKDEEYTQKTVNFSGMTDIIREFLQIVCGAADVPATRLLGMSPGGMNATGESDLRNYYDKVRAEQELEMRPAMAVLDECLIRSALGSRPEEIHYSWAPLWQISETERADNLDKNARSIKTLSEAAVFSPDALSAAAANLLIENGAMPGLEEAVDEFPIDQEAEQDARFAAAGAVAGEAGTEPFAVGDAAPRTLYVSRAVLNAEEILEHYRAQGVGGEVLDAADMHVTIAYSRTPVDWMKVGTPWSQDAENMRIPAGGARLNERFGDAFVLLFNSSELAWRNVSIREAGASWDHPEYQPHVTISYGARASMDSVKPWQGAIELGPEIFAEVDDGWKIQKNAL